MLKAIKQYFHVVLFILYEVAFVLRLWIKF